MKINKKLKLQYIPAPSKENVNDAPSWLVYVVPPPLKEGPVFFPHVPLKVITGSFSSWVTFFTVALRGFHEAHIIKQEDDTYPAGAS